ncbi:MAG TPA: S-layer homology domain-containing protein [Clostridiaceae bacterium]|nr:S-layer homology domain-containing protein [Clostridiaceae bacterium]
MAVNFLTGKKGLMGGVGNNRFSPHGNFTREQSIVTMLRLFHVVK